jgi:hypothetical protein
MSLWLRNLNAWFHARIARQTWTSSSLLELFFDLSTRLVQSILFGDPLNDWRHSKTLCVTQRKPLQIFFGIATSNSGYASVTQSSPRLFHVETCPTWCQCTEYEQNLPNSPNVPLKLVQVRVSLALQPGLIPSFIWNFRCKALLPFKAVKVFWMSSISLNRNVRVSYIDHHMKCKVYLLFHYRN